MMNKPRVAELECLALRQQQLVFVREVNPLSLCSGVLRSRSILYSVDIGSWYIVLCAFVYHCAAARAIICV